MSSFEWCASQQATEPEASSDQQRDGVPNEEASANGVSDNVHDPGNEVM